ncbi:MAG TPA: hypothetical protein DF984_08110 [Anaerolineaceae bacterium]|jgi:F-type H+-transporting ATPase subunit epsilon|nr:hypothetical protein [Anaerolineaceae bacterium]
MTSFKPLSLRILSPEGPILEVDEAASINVPLADGGGIGIRPGHAPLIAETGQGPVRYQTAGGEDQIEVMPGILEIFNNVVTILTVPQISDHLTEPDHNPKDEFTQIIEAISQELINEEKRSTDKTA